jgi:sugar lactone lactonase YvrE
MQSFETSIDEDNNRMSPAVNLTTIHTIAGTGEGGFGGDGRLAIDARLNEPKAVTLDERGNLFIADSENHVVRKVDRATGTISTVAGCPEGTGQILGLSPSGPEPVAECDDPFSEPRSSKEVAFVQQADVSGMVRYVVNGPRGTERFGGDGGPASEAWLNFPTAVAVDRAGNVYIADTLNHRVRLVEAETGRITTIAGIGRPRYGGDGGPAVLAGLHEPAALVISEAGTLYVADQSNHRVRAIDRATGLIRTVAGTGSATYNGDGIPATEASLAGPSGLALAKDGTLFIADTFNGRIRAVDPVTGLIRTVVGEGGVYRFEGIDEPPSVHLSRPSGIAVDRNGNLFITDSDNHLIRRWDSRIGRLERLAGAGVAGYEGDGRSPLDATLNYPFGVAVEDEGHLYIADTFNHRIRRIVR